MATKVFWFIRVGVFAAAILFSIIVLGLGAAYIAKINSLGPFFKAPDFAGLAVAIAVISLVTLTPLLAIDIIRQGAITSWIMVELAIVGVLSILWLATAADTASASDGQTVDCSVADGLDSDAGMLCHTYQGIEAFSFLAWILLKGYVIFLAVITLISASRGNSNVWKSTVRDHDFFANNKSANVAMAQQAKYTPSPMPVQQQQYPPQQYGTPPPQQYGTPAPQQGYAAQV